MEAGEKLRLWLGLELNGPRPDVFAANRAACRPHIDHGPNLYGSLPGLILKEFDYVERLSVDSRMTRQPRETQNTLRLNILL